MCATEWRPNTVHRGWDTSIINRKLINLSSRVTHSLDVSEVYTTFEFQKRAGTECKIVNKLLSKRQQLAQQWVNEQRCRRNRLRVTSLFNVQQRNIVTPPTLQCDIAQPILTFSVPGWRMSRFECINTTPAAQDGLFHSWIHVGGR